MNASAVPPATTATAVTAVVAVACCAAAAAVVLRAVDPRLSRAVPAAALRALVQLAAVAVLVAAVWRSPGLSLLFVAGMAVVASVTAGRRATRDRSGLWLATAVTGGALPVLAALTVGGLVPWDGAALVPTGGILVGGAMTAAGLAGRLALDELRERRDVWEGALALGLSVRTAGLLVIRGPAARALLPGLDQTRTVGTVSLPGTFVGLLLGGSPPLVAAGVQLVVLVALLLVQAVAVLVTVELVARGWVTRPGESA